MAKRTFCGLCTSNCGIEVHVQRGRVTKVIGDSQSPFGKGQLCIKASGLVDLHRHADRLNYPLKRAGKRGEGKWERISWSQALDEIASKLAKIRDRFGPEALVSMAGTIHNGLEWAAWRFCNLFGSPNIFAQGKNCGEPEFLSELATYGYDTRGSSPVPGLTRCFIAWGVNPSVSRHVVWRSLLEAQKSGMKLVVIDPRLTETAAKADIWVQPRPGTDGALALGMMNTIISENLYDKKFVDEWCLGFDKLQVLVHEYPSDRASRITGIPVDKIIMVARLYATNKPAIISRGVALCHLGSATKSAIQGRMLLRVITGNIDNQGGQVLREGFPNLAWTENMFWDRLANHPLRTRDNVSAHKISSASVRGYSLYREAMKKVYPKGYTASQYLVFVSPYYLWPAILEGKPYPIRAMITAGGNPLTTVAGGRKIYQALKSENLELHVGMDLFMTPTLELADYVLPAADCLEQPSIRVNWGLDDSFGLGEQPVEPLYERRGDYQLWRELGARLGQEEHWPETLEGMIDRFLEPTGLTSQEALAKGESYFNAPRHFEKYKEKGFATFSGKVELVPSLFEKLGYDPLPSYEEPPQSPERTPELAKEFPLILISGARNRYYVHSTLRQIKRLREKSPDPLVQIHPETARRLGIRRGDWVCIETTVGRIKQKAELTESVSPEVVHAEGYWWFPEKPDKDPELFGVWESNINAIIPDEPETCSFSGDQFFRGALCKVYKADP